MKNSGSAAKGNSSDLNFSCPFSLHIFRYADRLIVHWSARARMATGWLVFLARIAATSMFPVIHPGQQLPMVYSGPIDLEQLIDLDAIYAAGECPYTFLAFPKSVVNEEGVPSDADAQRYIAAVQTAGVPVGVWITSPVDFTAYAAVARDSIESLHNVIGSLTSRGQFPPSFAADLSENLFRDESVFNHLLVQFDDIFPALYSRWNQLYEHHRRQERGEYTPNEWDRFHPEIPPVDRYFALLQSITDDSGISPKDDAEYYRMVGQFWTAPELLTNSSGSLEILIVPSHVNVPHMMTQSELAALAEFPETVTVHRGHNNACTRHGLSWTLDRDMALQWAVGLPGNDSISTGVVVTKKIMAYINRRDESEIIVSTNDVMDIVTRDIG